MPRPSTVVDNVDRVTAARWHTMQDAVVPRFAELMVFGESHSQGVAEDNFVNIAGSVSGVASVRNNGKSGSKIVLGDLDNPNVGGTPAGVMVGGYGQVYEDTAAELRQRSAFTDSVASPTTLNPLIGNIASVLVYGPNDLATFGNSAAAVATMINAYRAAISARRAGRVFGPNNPNLSYSGGFTAQNSFAVSNGSWGVPGGTQYRDAANGATITYTLPTDLADGMVLQVYRGVKAGSTGSMGVTINASPVTGSPFAQPTPGPGTGYIAPHVNRIPLTAAMSGQTLVLTFNVTGGALTFGGIGFEPSLTSAATGMPAPVFITTSPRMPDAAAAVWFASGLGWFAVPSDAGAALLNAGLATLATEFDRFVQIVDMDAALNKTTTLFNPGDVHFNTLGNRLIALAFLTAMNQMAVSRDDALMGRPITRPPTITFPVVPASTAGYTWTTQPTAETQFLGATGAGFVLPAELSKFHFYRLLVDVTTASTAGGVLFAKYSIDNGVNWTGLNYDGPINYVAGTSGNVVSLTTTGRKVVNWDQFHHGARNNPDVLLGIFGTATAATGNPIVRSIQLQFR